MLTDKVKLPQMGVFRCTGRASADFATGRREFSPTLHPPLMLVEPIGVLKNQAVNPPHYPFNFFKKALRWGYHSLFNQYIIITETGLIIKKSDKSSNHLDRLLAKCGAPTPSPLNKKAAPKLYFRNSLSSVIHIF